MADIFVSFSTSDTVRVKTFIDGFRAKGLSVFWSNNIPPGSHDYQETIIQEMDRACVVVVLWTATSVKSSAVAQECSQATKDGKLFQVVLDVLDPIDFPMEVNFKSQKTILINWSGDNQSPCWTKLVDEIKKRVGSARVQLGNNWSKSSTLTNNRRLSDIAKELRDDWGADINPSALEYVKIMDHFGAVTETRLIVGYPAPLSGHWVISHILTHCSTWKGPVARRIKRELRALHELCELAQETA